MATGMPTGTYRERKPPNFSCAGLISSIRDFVFRRISAPSHHVERASNFRLSSWSALDRSESRRIMTSQRRTSNTRGNSDSTALFVTPRAA